MNRTLETRLRTVERYCANADPFSGKPVIRIITESDEDQERQLADLQAKGEYEPGQFVIAWRIVDPPPYRHPMKGRLQ